MKDRRREKKCKINQQKQIQNTKDVHQIFLHITKISHTGVFRDGKVNDFKLFTNLNEIKDILDNLLRAILNSQNFHEHITKINISVLLYFERLKSIIQSLKTKWKMKFNYQIIIKKFLLKNRFSISVYDNTKNVEEEQSTRAFKYILYICMFVSMRVYIVYMCLFINIYVYV